jgi:cell wall-associated NlpC family hydrolase
MFASCIQKKKSYPEPVIATTDSLTVKQDTDETREARSAENYTPGTVINTGSTTPEELLAFANTLLTVPYKYASIDPSEGFDCSGFITYVFNHFNIAVPRSSVDFTNVGDEVNLMDAKPGDIALFTGTDSTIRVVGHMGIITSNSGGDVSFIHSTSGKADGVTITPLNSYYAGRFVKVIRIFPQNK